MSEPWHLLKPARQAGRRWRVLGARIDGCSRAGVIYGCRVQSDRRGQRTAIVVAFTVRFGGPFAKRLGLRRVTLYPRERDNDAGDQRKEHVEAGADHRAHVESAAAAAAFDVRRHAHGDACASSRCKTGHRCATAAGSEAVRRLDAWERTLRMAAEPIGYLLNSIKIRWSRCGAHECPEKTSARWIAQNHGSRNLTHSGSTRLPYTAASWSSSPPPYND